MTTPLQNAMMLSSIIGSILSNYDPKVARDRQKPILILRERFKKFMYVRSRSNKKEFLEAVEFADIAWKNSISHFVQQKLTIEAVSTIVRLYDLYEEPLTKYANVRVKQIEAYAAGITNDTTLEYEMNSYEVADYIIEQLATFSSVRRVSKFKKAA
jgi:hypothetical protein